MPMETITLKFEKSFDEFITGCVEQCEQAHELHAILACQEDMIDAMQQIIEEKVRNRLFDLLADKRISNMHLIEVVKEAERFEITEP